MKFEWTPEDTKGMKKWIPAVVAILAVPVLLFLWHQGMIGAFFKNCIRVMKPLFYAIVIAYILWPMMRFFEQKVFAPLRKEKPRTRLIRLLSLLCTYVIFLLILALFFSTVIPQIVDSLTSLLERTKNFIGTVQEWFLNLSPETPVVGPIIASSLFGELRSKLSDLIIRAGEWLYTNMYSIMSNAGTYVTTFATETKNVVLGIVFGVYFLLFKENLFAQLRKLNHSFLPDKAYDRTLHYVTLTDHTFGGFINGKLLDSLIIGLLCFILMKIFRMPYAPLISMIVGITNVIPFFGPLIGAIPSAFFILIAEPKMTLWFILLVVLLQQLDGNVIGPKILGDFVGLNPLWIIVSITIMGGFFGVFGMFFGVPTFAVIYAVIKELTEKRLVKIGKPPETENYYQDPAYEEIVNPKRHELKLPSLPVPKQVADRLDRFFAKLKERIGRKKK
ncbi:MAG: AI-2E family transporter [Clostridia bacterium]|nr:AI-2E family transporter [Clostridia bacterium]